MSEHLQSKFSLTVLRSEVTFLKRNKMDRERQQESEKEDRGPGRRQERSVGGGAVSR